MCVPSIGHELALTAVCSTVDTLEKHVAGNQVAGPAMVNSPDCIPKDDDPDVSAQGQVDQGLFDRDCTGRSLRGKITDILPLHLM